MTTQPTDLPRGDTRTVLVTGVSFIPIPPRTERDVLLGAARIIAANGLHQGDLVLDTFNRRLSSPHAARPMSIVAALHCAVSGDPHKPSPLGYRAASVLAHRLLVNGEGPYAEDTLALVWHVDQWGDAEGRTTESAVAVLEAAAAACEVTL